MRSLAFSFTLLTVVVVVFLLSIARVRFVAEEPRKTLFKYHPTPRTFYDAAYGEHWWEHSIEQWGEIWENHQTKVQSLKKYCKKQNLLEIDLVSMGKQGLHDNMWGALTSFLKLDAKCPVDGTKFPHRFVFRYSAVDQPKRQLGYAKARFLTWKHLTFGVVVVLLLRFFDGGQCTRSCRVENGSGNPNVLGRRGNWFEPHNVWGLRIGWDQCRCVNGLSLSSFVALNKTVVPRIHPEIQTKDQWWFSTHQVCGTDGNNYDTVDLARQNNVQATNCGQCSKCSGVSDVNAMHERSEGEGNSFGLTKRASVAAIGYLIGGEMLHRAIFRSEWLGFSNDCSECWYEATRCNLQSCAKYCLFGWENPLSVASTLSEKEGGGSVVKQLNSCMHCDEGKCCCCCCC